MDSTTNAHKLSTPLNNRIDNNNNTSSTEPNFDEKKITLTEDRKNVDTKRRSENLPVEENRTIANYCRQIGTSASASSSSTRRHCDLDDFLGLGVSLTSSTNWLVPPTASCTVDSRLCVKLIDVGEAASPLKSKNKSISKSSNPLLFRPDINSKANKAGWWRFYDPNEVVVKTSPPTISDDYDDIVQLCLRSTTEPNTSCSNAKSEENAKISKASSKSLVFKDIHEAMGKGVVSDLTFSEGYNAAGDCTNKVTSNNSAISKATKTVSSRLRCLSLSKIEEKSSLSEKSEQNNSLIRSETSVRSPMPNNGRGDEDDSTVFCKFCRKKVEFFEYYLGIHETECQSRISGGAIPKMVRATFNDSTSFATVNNSFDSKPNNNDNHWDRGDDAEDKEYEGQTRGRSGSQSGRIRCVYCNVSLSIDYVAWHQRECAKNPDVIEQREMARREEFERNVALWRSTPNPPAADWGGTSTGARRRERQQERHLEATVGKSRDIHGGDGGGRNAATAAAAGEFDYNQSYVDDSMSCVMLPCEYCQESYPGEIFYEHEKLCRQNQQQSKRNKASSAANA